MSRGGRIEAAHQQWQGEVNDRLRTRLLLSSLLFIHLNIRFFEHLINGPGFDITAHDRSGTDRQETGSLLLPVEFHYMIMEPFHANIFCTVLELSNKNGKFVSADAGDNIGFAECLLQKLRKVL